MKTNFPLISFMQRFVRLRLRKLNERVDMLSPMKKKVALFIFSICFSAISTYIIWEALVTKNIATNKFFIKRSSIPAHIGKTNDLKSSFTISPADFNRVELIKKYLGSLSFNDHIQYMEIIQLRPHLIDSIHLLETFYLQNLKK